MRPLIVHRLGVVAYEQGLAMQQALVEQRRTGEIPDTLLLLEHPAVITLGVKGDGGRSNIVASEAQLAQLGIAVHEARRGGDVTYHGPGQIVGYPIVNLDPDRRDVHRYVRDVEEVMIRVCADYGLTADRLKGMTGAWLRAGTPQAAKIGAIGVRISRWITSHGFAFNVNTDMSHFRLIVPCGLVGQDVTSLGQELGRRVALGEVEDALARHFGDVFGRTVMSASDTPRPATAVTSMRT